MPDGVTQINQLVVEAQISDASAKGMLGADEIRRHRQPFWTDSSEHQMREIGAATRTASHLTGQPESADGNVVYQHFDFSSGADDD